MDLDSCPETPDGLSYLEFDGGTLTLDRWSMPQIEAFLEKKIWTWDDRAQLWRTTAQNYVLVRKTLRERSIEAPLGVIDCVPRW
jgi:hypothetical protein